ncbi:Flp family type IVb pilin [Ralstonia insidiosa]|jgi:pilus assembly protein Flp/PilA|uniref:Pilus assembly protein n=1 Tax=Ralstonia insidiosa TaxID=190721 RepID=A0A192A2V0_9RALS|nr:Flp family type IVb pilin [Ralstonia insidiosa]ANJ74800.1 pilus assembly protein [Ralstonia insidiosa]KAB0467296.1 Flp family type IVb pilin [Ralstonia insidiosa]MBY4909530.1 Flp family type IVb pilin [Ralstonia insidiosa]
MKNAVLKFLRDEQGATAIEYGMIAGLIAAAIVTVVSALGTQITAKFQTICTSLKGSAC